MKSDSSQIATMMVDLYRQLGIQFNPSLADFQSFTYVLDANKNGVVTVEDLELISQEILIKNTQSTENMQEIQCTDYP